MSIHNMFSSRNKKNMDTFWLKKAPYQELCTSLCIIFIIMALPNARVTTAEFLFHFIG